MRYTHYTTANLQLQLNDNPATLQLQLQVQYNTLHPALVGEVPAAAIGTFQKSPTALRSISGFALPSMHRNSPLLWCPILYLKLPPPPCAVVLVYVKSLEVG